MFPPEPPIPPAEIQEISSALRDILAEIRSRTPLPKLLYHYTDAASVLGIAQSGVIRATHVAFMNDASEYLHAVKLLSNECHAMVGKCAQPLQAQILQKMISLLDDTSTSNQYPVFVACFSAAENSLNQWRAYSRGEGRFAIGFDRTALEESALRFGAGLAPVIYDDQEKLALVRRLLGWVLNIYPKRASAYSGGQQLTHMENWITTLFVIAARLAPLLKDQSFAEEREWRIVYMPGFQTQVQFLPKPNVLSGYVDLLLGKPQSHPVGWSPDNPGRKRPMPNLLPIREVWIGPGTLRELSSIAVKAMLENYGYDGVAIKTSSIPYRVT
jgi:hypothetical protein